MENLINRYRNVTILVAILFAQVLGLAIQVKRNSDEESTRLIRIWAVGAVTPLEKMIVWFQSGTSNLWHGYIYLRGVRQENRGLKEQLEQLRLHEARLEEDAQQARRLQSLLGFKEQFVAQTMAAQVIGLSGSPQSRAFYIDKGSDDGIAKDMAVITAEGVVGKVLRVYSSTSQVLMINDQSSGVGAILETSRLQGVLRGTPAGQVVLDKIMNDEPVQAGEKVLTSGGDQIFPKGLLIGSVSKVSQGKEFFLDAQVRPAADLSKLEEVLVITKEEDRTPESADNTPARAVDILERRLPSVPDKPVVTVPGGSSAVSGAPAKNGVVDAKPNNAKPKLVQPESAVETESTKIGAAKATTMTSKPANNTPAAATAATPSPSNDTPPAGEPPQ
jgi:rod shape-determining protein MreC